MEQFEFEFPASAAAAGRAVVGVVGSGDLEVLLEPHTSGSTRVAVKTAVDGMRSTWEVVLTRILTASSLPASRIEIHDFGATPGVVRMRIEQAFEQVSEQCAEQASAISSAQHV